MKPDFATFFARGVEHFNALEFWEAHEAWEEIWLAAESDVEQYLQGLIQLAAAYHHMRRGTLRGGVRLFDASLRRLSDFPHDYCGIDRSAAEAAARDHRAWATSVIARGAKENLDGAECPKLRRTNSDGALLPPTVRW
jgi:predicted metal-dependent hydrolase